MKIQFLVVALVCFVLAGFCIWFNYTQVAPNSVKHTLDLCMWASAVLGTIALVASGKK